MSPWPPAIGHCAAISLVNGQEAKGSEGVSLSSSFVVVFQLQNLSMMVLLEVLCHSSISSVGPCVGVLMAANQSVGYRLDGRVDILLLIVILLRLLSDYVVLGRSPPWRGSPLLWFPLSPHTACARDGVRSGSQTGTVCLAIWRMDLGSLRILVHGTLRYVFLFYTLVKSPPSIKRHHCIVTQVLHAYNP